MTKIDIVSGFLGAGKTTLIKKMVKEAYQGEKLVLIENEFGEISIDGGFLKDAGIQISEMSSGCICCSLVGDFGKALREVKEQFQPDRILIEPSGVGKLSDVIAAVERVQKEAPALQLHSFVTVVDATKAKIYMKNFGEFFNDQVEHASAILLSRTQNMDQAKLNAAVSLLRNKNPKAAILTTPWEQLTGDQIVSAMEGGRSLAEELLEEIGHSHGGDEAHHHHHHEHHDGEGCSCGHDHHDHEHHDEHDHHGHDHCHDEAACDVCLGHEHGHEHHHDHDEAACDACCGHHHHHGHDADEVFTSWGKETPKVFAQADIERILTALDSGDYGKILRAKGIVNGEGGKWIEFDFVPEEHEVRAGHPDYTGRLCVIGSELKEDQLEKLFLLA